MRFLSMKSEPGTNLSREELQSAPSRLERGLLNGPCLFKCPGSRTFLLRLGMSPGMRPPKQKQCPSGCEPHSGSLDDRQPSLCSCKTMHCWMESTLSPPQTSLSFFFLTIRHFLYQKVSCLLYSAGSIIRVVFVFWSLGTYAMFVNVSRFVVRTAWQLQVQQRVWELFGAKQGNR